MQVAETALKSKEQDLLAAEGELQAARQELQDRDRQLGNLAADLSGGEPETLQRLCEMHLLCLYSPVWCTEAFELVL